MIKKLFCLTTLQEAKLFVSVTLGYEYVERPNREERDFVETRQKTYWKYHITAILGLQIVLAAFTTPSNINDTTMLPVMLAEIRRRGFDFVGGLL